MADVALIWNNAIGFGDIGMTGSALTVGTDIANHGDLETAVLISLFTDRTADPGDILTVDAANDPRGWWADIYTADPIGSKLYQVLNRATNQDTLNFARDTVLKALQWLIDDGIAVKIDCATRYFKQGAITIEIAIRKSAGPPALFSYVWNAPGANVVGGSASFVTTDLGLTITTDLGAGVSII